MGIFDSMLKDNESLFINEVALDFEFAPKKIRFREAQVEHIALCIRPLLMKRDGSHIIVYGPPGVGKTLAMSKILEEIEEVSQDIVPLYVNCWEYNSTYKIVLRLCELLGYKFVANKHTSELMEEVVRKVNKGGVVFVFDEIDKVQDMSFLYTILEQIYRKSIILVTNYVKDLLTFDERIKSRLTPDTLEFLPYNGAETEEILRERMNLAFVRSVWDEEAFLTIVEQTVAEKDIRKGLALLREAGNISESKSKRSVSVAEAEAAIAKLSGFANNKDRLNDDQKLILELCGEKQKIGDLFTAYQQKGGNASYKTFQRRIEDMEKNKFIVTEKTNGGKDGNTTLVSAKNTVSKIT